MDLKFFLAIYSDQIALLRKEKKQIVIQKLDALENFPFLYKEYLQKEVDGVKKAFFLKKLSFLPLKYLDRLVKKNERIKSFVKRLYNWIVPQQGELVMGLEAKQVLLRSLQVKLQSKRAVLLALPFQLETLIPYPKEKLLLLPALYKENKQTEVLLLASSADNLEELLQLAFKIGVDPDIVSCIPLALFRFVKHFYPEQSSFYIYHEQEDTSCFIAVENNRLIAFQSLGVKDFARTCAYMQNKYPLIRDIFYTGEEKPSSFIPLVKDADLPLQQAIVIGLALDAAMQDEQSAQFRIEGFSSKKVKKRKKNLLFRYFAACSFLFIAMSVFTHFHIGRIEKSTLQQINMEEMSLSHAVHGLEKAIAKQKQVLIPIANTWKVHQVLSWISQHPHLQQCPLTYLRYQIVAEGPSKLEMVKIEMEINSPQQSIARVFHEALLKDQVMIDQKKGVKWSANHGIYRAIFYLKPPK